MRDPERHERAVQEAAKKLRELYAEKSQNWSPCDKIAFWATIEQYAKVTREDIQNYGGQ